MALNEILHFLCQLVNVVRRIHVYESPHTGRGLIRKAK